MSPTRLSLAATLALLVLGCGEELGDPFANCCVTGFTDEQADHIKSAALEWNEALPAEVGLTFDDSKPCELAIIGVATARHGGSFGYTAYEEKKIELLNTSSSLLKLRTIALHEFGHWLGGGEHSDVRADVMFSKFTGQEYLTGRDISRVRQTIHENE